ncbi:alpha/beta fold hydrolase [Janthinobacterium agaricidamnosum]|uniref:Alpha/beta hydrolase fold family protein n=1 Tax=Janthinobacterium agaricidamnosum NBRC 102515 = DSM 9628 TaxID=1349767 RepID=W0V1L2_9BURK|nr:alpha/beta hydrolase [Janthinobacterium agaricidamnosum]CDG81228.1 alpha/beta hydrolase fold family protein [Janthinobacterium agaricidamnosum NBRC 102515 = DSM 9628]
MSTPSCNTRAALRTVDADGVNIFYREAGPKDAPVILLLHGFPSSSFMYRELIPLLATRYRVIAPDLPGFGFTSVPAERNYVYTFDNLALTAEAFVQALGLKKYALYVFDYGAPVGLRLAASQPQRVTALVSQNGNAYLDGLGDAWAPIQAYWADPSAANRDVVRGILNLEGVKWQYTHGVANALDVAPETYYLDMALMERPGNREIQLDLFLDYASNLEQYPAFQQFFREHQPPTLVIWGKHDPFFIPPGAAAYQRDNPDALVRMLDTGHFALETHVGDIAAEIHALLEKAAR